MVNPTNTAAIANATDRPWDEWVRLLDEAGARQMKHTDIAATVLDLMPESASQKEWWAQSVAVAYGQHAGLRVPGQTSSGDFQLSTSKTFSGDKDAALQAWMSVVASHAEFGGVPVDGEASTSRTEKWRYWRVRLTDGTRVEISIGNKPNGKSSLGLVHAKLDSAETIEQWRPYWKDLLAQL